MEYGWFSLLILWENGITSSPHAETGMWKCPPCDFLVLPTAKSQLSRPRPCSVINSVNPQTDLRLRSIDLRWSMISVNIGCVSILERKRWVFEIVFNQVVACFMYYLAWWMSFVNVLSKHLTVSQFYILLTWNNIDASIYKWLHTL